MISIHQALKDTPWAEWTASPIAADASDRSYVRLAGPDAATVVVMNSGPVPTAPFVQMADYLYNIGLAAPRVLLDRSPILVLTDLGTKQLAQALDQRADATALYSAAVDALIALHHAPPPNLPNQTAQALGTAVRITSEFYAPNADAETLSNLMTDAITRLTGHLPWRVALRDCHVENMIWRPDEHGTARIGLLDFQDAVMMPAGYDLVSLIRDIRRPMSADLTQTLTDRFCDGTGLDKDRFTAARAALAAQRNLRILGVFARLITVRGKPAYARHLPLTWTTLTEDLNHPELSALQAYVQRTFPDPRKAVLIA